MQNCIPLCDSYKSFTFVLHFVLFVTKLYQLQQLQGWSQHLMGSWRTTKVTHNLFLAVLQKSMVTNLRINRHCNKGIFAIHLCCKIFLHLSAAKGFQVIWEGIRPAIAPSKPARSWPTFPMGRDFGEGRKQRACGESRNGRRAPGSSLAHSGPAASLSWQRVASWSKVWHHPVAKFLGTGLGSGSRNYRQDFKNKVWLHLLFSISLGSYPTSLVLPVNTPLTRGM